MLVSSDPVELSKYYSLEKERDELKKERDNLFTVATNASDRIRDLKEKNSNLISIIKLLVKMIK